ncbi:hypothetical protein ACF0HT_14165 (plasmid) [Staphylococcus xylosus]
MSSVTGNETNVVYTIKRESDKPLETRYYLDSNKLNINLGDYLSNRSLRRIENYYQNHQANKIKESPLYQMVIRLFDWETIGNQIKV